jgi:hypothetical protein
LSLSFDPVFEVEVVSGSTLYFIDPACRLFEALRLFNLVQAGQLVNIEGNVFQGVSPLNKT